MQIPILSGVYTDSKADYRVAFPVNMKPILLSTGISEGYLRPVEGITAITTSNDAVPGVSRGAINWNGTHYRVMGSKICKVTASNVFTDIGGIETDTKHVTMTYSFDRLAIASNEKLWYVNPSDEITEVTDGDLGTVLDVIWVDGYFMTTDGEFLVVTELTDPTVVNPLKYGSSEIDPDPIVGVKKLLNEPWAINRYSMEVFRNVGGSLFPFSRVQGGHINRGAFGTHCAIPFGENMAFLGSGRNESPGVFMASNGRSQRVSSREIDEILEGYTEAVLAAAVLEVVGESDKQLLWVRLSNRTLVFDAAATELAGQPVWYVMSSSATATPTTFRGIDVIWCYDGWQVGDATASSIGVLTEAVSTQYGDNVYWEFSTPIIYNESRGAIIHSIELVSLTGRAASGEPTVGTAYSLDGVTWGTSQPKSIGVSGDRVKRVIWRRQGDMRNIRIQRFTGNSQVYMAISALEVELEALSA
jgi:hypothetical protein